MKKSDYFILVGDALLGADALMQVLSGRASAPDWIVLFLTVPILVGYVIKIICDAKKKR
jgi:hypothetical protein